MFKIERKIVEFVERNVNILFMLAITGLAIVVRYAGRDFVSGDMTWFFLGWFQKIADNGGIHSLKNQVGDYNICLLYTSPSPRDGLLSRMPSSA